MEYWLPDHPGQELFSQVFAKTNEEMRISDGLLSPRDVPGLGLECDPEAVKRYTVTVDSVI
jgi:L-alanine-DL-glutamate epimerase-like enolase superfamily enzyme